MQGIATSETGEAVRSGFAALIGANHDLKRLRSLRTDPIGFDAELWRQLAREGWLRSDVPEQHGGAGLASADAAIVYEVLGEMLLPEPYVALCLLPARILQSIDDDAARALLAQLLDGERRVALAWMEKAGTLDGDRPATTVSGQRICGTKRFVAAGSAADTVLVTCLDEQGALVLALAPATAARMTPIRLIDGAVAADLVFDDVPASAVLPLAPNTLARALDDARVAVAVQLLGVARQALRITLDYARVRRQFGAAIGSFQALQHRLVNMAADLRRAEVTCDRAIELRGDVRAFPAAAAAAKASATRAAQSVTQGAIQVHGAIGYTDEADIGLYLAAALRLAPWFGGAEALSGRYGALIAETAHD